MEKQTGEAHIEKLELDAIHNLAAQLYTNQPERIELPEDFAQTNTPPQETLFEDQPDDLKRAILPDELVNNIYEYMKTNNVDDFSAAINQLIYKGLQK